MMLKDFHRGIMLEVFHNGMIAEVLKEMIIEVLKEMIIEVLKEMTTEVLAKRDDVSGPHIDDNRRNFQKEEFRGPRRDDVQDSSQGGDNRIPFQRVKLHDSFARHDIQSQSKEDVHGHLRDDIHDAPRENFHRFLPRDNVRGPLIRDEFQGHVRDDIRGSLREDSLHRIAPRDDVQSFTHPPDMR